MIDEEGMNIEEIDSVKLLSASSSNFMENNVTAMQSVVILLNRIGSTLEDNNRADPYGLYYPSFPRKTKNKYHCRNARLLFFHMDFQLQALRCCYTKYSSA